MGADLLRALDRALRQLDRRERKRRAPAWLPWLPPPPIEAAGLPTFQALGTPAHGQGDITPTWPTHQADDIGLLFCETAAQAVTAPSGWVEVTNSPQSNPAATTRLTVFWKRAASSSETNPTVTDPGDHVYGVILTFRGCEASGNPWNVTAGGAADSTTAHTLPSVTTTENDCLIVLAIAWGADNAGPICTSFVNVNLAGITERQDEGTTDGNGGGIGVATGTKAVAGSTGTTALVTSAATSGGYLTIALKAAGSPFTAAGSGSVAFAGASVATATSGATGSSTAAFADSSTAAATEAIVGTSTAAFGASAVGLATLAVAGVATAGFGGAAIASADDDEIAGMATVGFGGASIVDAPASVSFAGTSTATFGGGMTVSFDTEVILVYAVDAGVTVHAVGAIEVDT